MKPTKLNETVVIVVMLMLLSACVNSSETNPQPNQKHQSQNTIEQIKVTKLAQDFVDAMKKRVEAKNNNNFTDEEVAGYESKWITPTTRISQTFAAYLSALAFKYKAPDGVQIDGLGMAELSNNIGTITYRYGSDDCFINLVNTDQGWRIVATNCTNHKLRRQ